MRAYVTNTSEPWPIYLTASQFPDGSGECLTATAVQNESCPAGGYTAIAEVVPNFDALLLDGYNITFFNDGVSRYLASSQPFSNSTAWITSSIGQVQARSLALFNQWNEKPWIYKSLWCRLFATPRRRHPASLTSLLSTLLFLICPVTPSGQRTGVSFRAGPIPSPYSLPGWTCP
jgi:hypothetical protein